jgi:hypothetical protein
MWAPLSHSPEAAKAVEGPSSYFTTESHYLALANRIVAALNGGGCVVLITSDLPVVPHLLSQALRAAKKSRHAVISIACRADLTSEELLRARSIVAALPSNGEATERPQPLEAAPAIVLFADADQLSDERIREICSFPEDNCPKDIAVLLLARPTFLARLEEQSLQFLKEGRVIQFTFLDVRRGGGIDAFRHQLAAREKRKDPTAVATGAVRALAALGIFLVLASGAFLFSVKHHLAGLRPTSSDGDIASLSTLLQTPADTSRQTPSNVSSPPEAGASGGTPQPAFLAASPATDLHGTVSQAAAQPVPSSVAAQDASTSAPPPNSQPSSAEIAALQNRGDGFLSVRDITSARLFYERAADAGSASAALRLGATFDPGFLSGAGISEIFRDATQAASWYHRARDLGDPDAESWLENLHHERAGELNQSHR